MLSMDDEEMIRQMGGATLHRMCYNVCVVSHGAEAVREFSDAIREGRPFSLAILDLTIVGSMGGFQTLEELRRMDTGIKAIASSGYSNDAVLSDYKAHGFQGIVAEPYEASDLALAMGLVLKGARV
jgi:CheY-like chemotaxis protein